MMVSDISTSALLLALRDKFVVMEQRLAALEGCVPETAPTVYEFENIVVDQRSRTAHRDGEPIKLTRKEYELLAVLISDPERVFTKQELTRIIWNQEVMSTSRTLDSHAARLRGKLGGRLVINRWSHGYSLAHAKPLAVVA